MRHPIRQYTVATFLVFCHAVIGSAEVRGFVMTPEGAAVAAASVVALAPEASLAREDRIRTGQGVRTALGSAKTGSNGSFALSSPGPGAIDIFVEAAGFAPALIRAEGNENVGVIVLRSAPAIGGQVTSEGMPVEGARIHYFGAAGDEVIRVSGSDGRFTSPDPGVWAKSVKVFHSGFASFAGYTPLPLNLQLVPARAGAAESSAGKSAAGPIAATLKGVVTAEGGAKLAGAIIRLFPSAAASSEPRTFVSDSKGEFSSSPLPAGSYRAETSYPNHLTGTKDVTLSRAVTNSLHFTLPPAAIVTGTVVDEDAKPLAGIQVYRVGSAGPVTLSAPDGTFVLRGITPAPANRFEAFRQGRPPAQSDDVPLAAGARSQLSFVLQKGIRLHGRVVDGEGEAVPGVAISAAPAEPGAPFRALAILKVERGDFAITDESGRFSLLLGKSPCDVELRKEGFVTVRIAGFRPDQQEGPLELTIDRAVEISGVVIQGGEPVEGATVSAKEGRASPEYVVTDHEGKFRLMQQLRGPVVLGVLSPARWIAMRRNVEAPVTGLRFELPAGVEVVGKVVDRSTGKGLAAASLVLTSRADFNAGPATLSRSIDVDGSFTIADVPAGELELVASAKGFPSVRVTLSVEPSVNPAPIEIALERGVVVEGRVFSSTATVGGLPGVSVTIRSAETVRQGRELSENLVSAVTDGDGRFTIEGVPRGERTLSFFKEGYVPGQMTMVVGNDAPPLRVELRPGVRLTGRVIADDATPLPGAEVAVVSSLQSSAGQTGRTNDQGEFLISGLAPGRYTVRASGRGFAESSQRIVEIGDSTPLPIVIELRRGATISGRVLSFAAANGAAGTVTVAGGGSSASAAIGTDGTFRVTGSPLGTVRIWALFESAASSMRSAMKTVETRPGELVTVNLELMNEASVRGRVTRGGAGAPNLVVTFLPAEVRMTTRSAAPTDAGGNYEVTGLERGRYKVRVLDDRQVTLFETTHEASGSGALDIAIRTSIVRGKLIDAETDEAIAGAVVSIQKQDGGEVTTVTSDARGLFTLDTVPLGEYRVTVQKDGYEPSSAPLSVTETAPSPVELRLTTTTGVLIRVVDRRGNPLESEIIVLDATQRPVYRGKPRPRPDGAVRLPLGKGIYSATFGTFGYSPRTVELQVPSQPAAVVLLAGGSVVITSTRPERARVRLMLEGGMVYLPDFWNRSGNIALDPGTITLKNVPPGKATLLLLDDSGAAAKSYPMTVEDEKDAAVLVE